MTNQKKKSDDWTKVPPPMPPPSPRIPLSPLDPPVEDQRAVEPYDPWKTFTKALWGAVRGGVALAGGALLTFLMVDDNLKMLLNALGVKGAISMMLAVPTLMAVIVGANNWWKNRFGVYPERRENMRVKGPVWRKGKRQIVGPRDQDFD